MIIYRFEFQGQGVYSSGAISEAYYKATKDRRDYGGELNPMYLSNPSDEYDTPVRDLFYNVLSGYTRKAKHWLFGFRSIEQYRDYLGPLTREYMVGEGIIRLKYAIHDDHVKVGNQQVVFFKPMATLLDVSMRDF